MTVAVDSFGEDRQPEPFTRWARHRMVEAGVRIEPLARLTTALRNSWDASTSANEHWTPSSREAGQCAVTALVVQDMLGGELLRASVSGTSHYWNRLPTGEEIDLTRSQFPSFHPEGIQIRDREYVLSFPNTFFSPLVSQMNSVTIPES